MTAETERLIVVGTGGRRYRAYALEALAARYNVGLVLPDPPTWQAPFGAVTTVTDVHDPAAIVDAVTSLSGDVDRFGLLTWDETLLSAVATAAYRLGARHLSPEAVANCRDKHRTRMALDAAGLGAVRHRLVHTLAEALAAADELGYPVVLKPRALAGSVGVVKADSVADVRRLFAVANDARFSTLPAGVGVLVEEYLDGPEVSVDSVAFDGDVHVVHVARKRLGFEPHFEEVGHLVLDATTEPWFPATRALVVDAHRALGAEDGVTHAEVRLTSAGPRLVELNGRLGGDLIPLLGRLATGIDLVVAAAEVALGRRPDLTPSHDRAAEVRFAYPPHDCVVGHVEIVAAAETPGVERVVPLADPGTTLLLPPRGAIPRLAALIAVGGDERACRDALDRAGPLIVADVDDLSSRQIASGNRAAMTSTNGAS